MLLEVMMQIQDFSFKNFERWTFFLSLTSFEMQLKQFINKPGILSCAVIRLLLPAS